jgi:PilZ domain
MKQLGDRRICARFEIVGTLRGMLDLYEVARVLDISNTGALLESMLPTTVHSTQVVRIAVDETEVVAEAYVRHVRQVVEAGMGPRHLIGLEFVSPPASLRYAIEQLASRHDDVV